MCSIHDLGSIQIHVKLTCHTATLWAWLLPIYGNNLGVWFMAGESHIHRRKGVRKAGQTVTAAGSRATALSHPFYMVKSLELYCMGCSLLPLQEDLQCYRCYRSWKVICIYKYIYNIVCYMYVIYCYIMLYRCYLLSAPGFSWIFPFGPSEKASGKITQPLLGVEQLAPSGSQKLSRPRGPVRVS